MRIFPPNEKPRDQSCHHERNKYGSDIWHKIVFQDSQAFQKKHPSLLRGIEPSAFCQIQCSLLQVYTRECSRALRP